MITSDVRDWLSKEFPEFNDHIYNGPLFDTKKECLMSINRGTTLNQQRPLGGLINASYSRLACNCIIHWNKKSKDTETMALKIRDFLLNAKRTFINGYAVAMISIRNFIPIGKDEHDIYEFAIDFEIIYMRTQDKDALESEE